MISVFLRAAFAVLFLFPLLSGGAFCAEQQNRHWVRLDSYTGLDAALSSRAFWRSFGYAADVSENSGYDVVMGPFSTEEHARALAERILVDEKRTVSVISDRGASPGTFQQRIDALDPIEADRMLQAAMELLGRPYRFGGENPEKGIDCSSFTQLICKVLGAELPRTARGQFKSGRKIKPEDMQVGDLVFFKNTYRRGISHVGIYIGNGEFIHAASGSAHKVTISSLADTYYRRHFAGIRRILEVP